MQLLIQHCLTFACGSGGAEVDLCAMLIGVRTILFTVLLGFHNALEQDDAALEEVAVHLRIAHRDPLADLLARPERCFFWNESSLLN